MKIKKYYNKLKESPTLKKAKEEFKQNIGSIEKGESKIRYKKTKLDKKLSNIKYGIDVGLGFSKKKRKGGKK